MGTLGIEKTSYPSANRFGIIVISPDEVWDYYRRLILEDAGPSYMQNIVTIQINSQEHFWTPYCKDPVLALEVLWNVAQELVEKHCCRYVAAATGAVDLPSVMDCVSTLNHQAWNQSLPVIRLSDVLQDEIRNISRFFYDIKKRWPRIYLAGSSCLSNLPLLKELPDSLTKKWGWDEHGKPFVKKWDERDFFMADYYWSTMAETLQSSRAELLTLRKDSWPSLLMDKIILDYGMKQRMPSLEEKDGLRKSLLLASEECDYIIIACYELQDCLDQETIQAIHDNDCLIINGAELHARKIAKLIRTMPLEPC